MDSKCKEKRRTKSEGRGMVNGFGGKKCAGRREEGVVAF